MRRIARLPRLFLLGCISASIPAQAAPQHPAEPVVAAYVFANNGAAEQKTFVSYEDPESLGVKCDYVLSHKLAGMMFWSYLDDTSGALLRSIDDGLHPEAAR
ncbi:MAG TPA: glycosyl hydrolase family 18 protein [Terracidiphilus sp.]|jgi:GH18 family chitinase|nr:glycosyl hydrolase family 18 protein [Terracidiphilus sp.]